MRIGTWADADLEALFDEVNPGVVSIQIFAANPCGVGIIQVGVVSAVGRTIPSLAAAGQTGQPYQIPQAIQTDAAINPGNSGDRC